MEEKKSEKMISEVVFTVGRSEQAVGIHGKQQALVDTHLERMPNTLSHQ